MRALNLSLAIGLALALPVAAVAAPAGAPTDLDQVVVTANRTAVSVNDALVPVEVIDRADIERSQARDLIDLLRGRYFERAEEARGLPYVIISQSAADMLFPGEDPLNQRVRMGPQATGPWTTIVGVIGDVRHGGLEEVPQPELYITSLQNPPVAPFIVLRVAGDPAAMTETVRAEARAIEDAFLKAYRWQYIHSGAQHPQFGKVLSGLITEKQGQRIQAALATLQ